MQYGQRTYCGRLFNLQLDTKPNYAALEEKISRLQPLNPAYTLGDTISIKTDDEYDYKTIAQSLKSWRKGAFSINDLFIDSEWRSFIKYNLIKDHLDISGKTVLDLGCNNGYYLFRMLDKNPKKLIGFDPSYLFFLQFLFINRFIGADIEYKMQGSDDLPNYKNSFDTVVCLGVIYHRPDPITMLKNIAASLKNGGELIIDSLIIEDENDTALCPKQTYAKMPNVWFIPTVQTLFNWLERCGFHAPRLIATRKTDITEQRKTEWINGESLEHFLDPNDHTKTFEGYNAPIRAYISARRR